MRAWFAARGRAAFTWHVADTATPTGVKERLLALGAEPFPGWESAECMTLTEPPPQVDGIEIRELTTLAEHEAREDLSALAFGWGDEHRDAAKAKLRRFWDGYDTAVWRTDGAYLDGKLVAVGIATFTPHGVYLDGASTLPAARGRGAYTALVRARWDEAVRRGTPGLAVQAGPLSAPILRRLGFRTVGGVDYLRDSTTLA